LLLLKKGGQMVFFGELGQESQNLIEYFEGIVGVLPCPVGANPAAWMLEVIGGGTGIKKVTSKPSNDSSHSYETGTQLIVNEEEESDDEVEELDEEALIEKDFAAVYRNSKLKRINDERIRTGFRIPAEYFQSNGDFPPVKERVVLRERMQFHTSYFRQYSCLLFRNFTELWRSPDFSFLRFVVVVAFAVMFVAIFYQQKVENMADIQSRILCITFSMSLASMFTMLTIIPFTINRRAVFYRERGAGMYHSAIFAAAAGFSEVPYLLVTSSLIVNIVYFGVGFNPEAFPYYYFVGASFTYLLLMAFIGMLMASLLPDILSAQLAASAFFSVMNTFAGISVPLKHIPRFYVWLHYLSPLRWYFEGILSTQFHGDTTIICNPIGKPVHTGLIGKLKLCTKNGENDFHLVSGVQVTVEEFVLKDFLDGFDYDRRWMDVGILVVWIFAARLLAVMATSYISFDKR